MKLLQLANGYELSEYHLILPSSPKAIFVSTFRGYLICENLLLSDIELIDPISIPEYLSLHPLDCMSVKVESFHLYCIEKSKKNISFVFSFDGMDFLEKRNIKSSPLRIIRTVKKETVHFESISVIQFDDSKRNGELLLELRIRTPFLKNIRLCIKHAKHQLSCLLNQSHIRLNEFYWNPKYEYCEKTYSKDFLFPLFLKMGFQNIIYNHGSTEFGKDFIFQEVDKFGVVKNYAVQVKSGDISGNNNSQIDDIIRQISDAFQVPFIEVNSNSHQFISSFIIIISGYFTRNAKEKIVHKIPRGLHGSVYFFDKSKVQELMIKYLL